MDMTVGSGDEYENGPAEFESSATDELRPNDMSTQDQELCETESGETKMMDDSSVSSPSKHSPVINRCEAIPSSEQSDIRHIKYECVDVDPSILSQDPKSVDFQSIQLSREYLENQGYIIVFNGGKTDSNEENRNMEQYYAGRPSARPSDIDNENGTDKQRHTHSHRPIRPNISNNTAETDLMRMNTEVDPQTIQLAFPPEANYEVTLQSPDGQSAPGPHRGSVPSAVEIEQLDLLRVQAHLQLHAQKQDAQCLHAQETERYFKGYVL